MGSLLPDELWTKVLRMGVEAGGLDYRDLSSLAFVSRRLNRLSSLDCMWKPLWEQDFLKDGPKSGAQVHIESLRKVKEGETRRYREAYKTRFEKVKAAKMAAHRRRVLRVESQLAIILHESQLLQSRIEVERKMLWQNLTELKNIGLARSSAVAVQVWQPHAVRARQQEVLEQQPINMGTRQRSLEMEISVCQARIKQFETSLAAKRLSMIRVRVELDHLKFNPSRSNLDSVSNTSIYEKVGPRAIVKRKFNSCS